MQPVLRSRLRMPPVWIYAVLGVGVVLSLVLFATLRGWERREVNKRATGLAHKPAEKLEVAILRSMEVLYSIASLHSVDRRSGRERFQQFVRLTLARQSEPQALSRSAAAAPIQLAQGPENRAGFLVLLPVYSGPTLTTAESRCANLAGFAVAIFRVNDLVGGFFHELRRRGVEARLYDGSPSGALLYSENTARPKESAVLHLKVASWQWALEFEPAAHLVASASRLQLRLAQRSAPFHPKTRLQFYSGNPLA